MRAHAWDFAPISLAVINPNMLVSHPAPPARDVGELVEGSEPQTSTPAELTAHMRSESERWARVIKLAGFKTER